MKNDYEEIEIDLIAVFWRMAEQWKPIVLIGIVCGLLFASYSYWSDNRAYQKALEEMEEQEEGAIEDESGIEESNGSLKDSEWDYGADIDQKELLKMVDSLIAAQNNDPDLSVNSADSPEKNSVLDIEQVQSLLEKQERYEQYESYVEDSLLYQIDPLNKKVMYIRYLLKPKRDVILDEIGSHFVAALYAHEIVEEMADSFGDLDSLSVREIFSASYSAMNSEIRRDEFLHEGILSAAIILTDSNDEEKWKQIIDRIVRKLTDTDEEIYKNASIEQFDERVENFIDMDLLTKQSDAASKISSYKEEIKTAVSGFSNQQLRYYVRGVEQLHLNHVFAYDEAKWRIELSKAEENSDLTGENDPQEIAGEEEEFILKEPAVSIGKFVMGMLLGIFLYGIILVAFIILIPHVNEETCSTLLADRRTIRLREIKEPKGRERFFKDVIVYRWRNRGVPKLEQQMEDAASTLRYYARKEALTNYILLNVSSMTDSSEKIKEALIDWLKDESFSITSEMPSKANTEEFFEQIGRLTNVFLVSEYDVTKVSDLQKRIANLLDFDVKLAGHIVLG